MSALHFMAPMGAGTVHERTVPECIAKREPDAVYAWFSNRRLAVMKGEHSISLSYDDLARLKRFMDGFVTLEGSA